MCPVVLRSEGKSRALPLSIWVQSPMVGPEALCDVASARDYGLDDFPAPGVAVGKSHFRPLPIGKLTFLTHGNGANRSLG